MKSIIQKFGIVVHLLYIIAIFCIAEDALAITYNSTTGINYELDKTTKTACVIRSFPNVENLTIPEYILYEGDNYKVTTIGDGAFINQYNLVSVNMPNSITSIGSQSFYLCGNLSTVNLSNSLKSLGRSAFAATNLSSATLPNSLEIINDGVFSSCVNLTSISIGESVRTIGKSAFALCQKLSSITFPETLELIDYRAFYYCGLKTSITIPKSVKYIGAEAFVCALKSICVEQGNPIYDSRDNCNAIVETARNRLVVACQNTVIPNTVTTIGEYAFFGSALLTSILIPESITTIEDGAFNMCSYLTSIYIPASVSHIGKTVFYHCERLESIVVDPKNEYYDTRNDCNAIIDSKTNSMIAGCRNTIIPNTVKSIDGAFDGCTTLHSIEIPNSVTRIGDYAFLGCDSLEYIDIPASVTTIGKSAFSNTGLSNVTLPASISSIDEYAFNYGCEKIETIVALGEAPATITEKSFYYLQNRVTLYVPENSLPLYTTAEYWNKFENIRTFNGTASSVSLNCTDVSVNTDGGIQLFATVEPASALQFVAFSSDNPNVAIVDNKGNVTAINDGVATIYAKTVDGSNIVAKCKVTVGNAGVSDVVTDEFTVDVRSEGDEVFVKAQNAPTDVRCIIYNINGSVMADARVECSDDWASIANLRRGIYILQAISGNAVQTKRFIVR